MPNKKKRLKVVGVIVAVIALLAIGSFCAFKFAGRYIINQYMLMTKTEEEYFKWLANAGIEMAIREIESREESVVDSFVEKEPEKFESYNAGISLTYGSDDLLCLKATYDKKQNKLLAEWPSYRNDIVDFTKLIEKLKESLPELPEMSEHPEISEKVTNLTNAEIVDYIREYSKAVLDNIHTVKIEKNFVYATENEDINYYKLAVSMSGDELTKLVEDMTVLFNKEGLFEGYEPLEELQDAEAEVVLYLTNNLDIIGARINGGYLETKIGLEIFAENNDDESRAKIYGYFNSIKALTISCLSKTTGENETKVVDSSMSIVPDSFLTTFAGLSKPVELRIESRFGGDPYVDAANNKLIDYSEVMDKGYIELHLIIEHILKLRDILDNKYVDQFLEDTIQSFVGDSMIGGLIGHVDIASIRMMSDLGLFKQLGGCQCDGEQKGLDISGLISGLLPGMIGNGGEEATIEEKEEPEITPEPTAEPTAFPTLDPKPPVEPTALPTPDPQLTAEPTPKPEAVPETTQLPTGDIEESEIHYGPTPTIEPIPTAEPTTIETEKTIGYGDEILVDIVPIVYGMTMKQMAYQNAYAKIGEYTYGHGLDDQLIGLHEGEYKDLSITLPTVLPEGFPEEFAGFAGLQVSVRVIVNRITKTEQ